ncbi:adenylate kinase [Boudabousia marimammalium]|uniref:Adenylate kinase n=1 Tax=Boudabousia marimammalium TaxID=156892 RepID=A0A1Q5PJH7_9ACTO|nr:adenylate kinase [Boudabousia marimammalium]OKL46040.1 adenylate kinase [Boudabousia marimammalium]
MKRMILVGPPGAGKGTQAAFICRELNIPHISTGQIFRENMEQETELGESAKAYISRGEYVPDSVTNPMVKVRLDNPDAREGFLLDGYPRTVSQAKVLDEMLADRGRKLDLVLQITADNEAVVERLLKRAEIEHRPDDTEEVIRHRLDVYQELTEPLMSFYEEAGLLVKVDGNGSIDEVSDRIKAILEAK